MPIGTCALDFERDCIFCAHMHISLDDIDGMDLPELDEVRHHLRLSKRKLCSKVELCPSTYTRWMRHLQGRNGGSCPNRRSLKAVRQALKDEIAKRHGHMMAA